jgi:hypothetical protein
MKIGDVSDFHSWFTFFPKFCVNTSSDERDELRPHLVASIDKKNMDAPLHLATKYGRQNMVELLLDNTLVFVVFTFVLANKTLVMTGY